MSESRPIGSMARSFDVFHALVEPNRSFILKTIQEESLMFLGG